MHLCPRYYWFVNAGALIAFSGVAAVQQNVSFSWGFFIPFVSMILAIVFLQLARRHYIHKKLTGTVFFRRIYNNLLILVMGGYECDLKMF